MNINGVGSMQNSSSNNNNLSSGSGGSNSLNSTNIDLNLYTGGKQLVKNEIICTDLRTDMHTF